MHRPAKAAACAHLADLLATQFDYDPALAAAVAAAVDDPAAVRRRLAENDLQDGPHGTVEVGTRMWLPMLTPVSLGFDWRYIRPGGKALAGPTEPPRLAVHDFDLHRDAEDPWEVRDGLYPDNRAWLTEALRKHAWVWERDLAIRIAPLTWVSEDSGRTAPTLTIVDDNSTIVYSARDLLLARLTELGAREDDLARLLARDRDALRRAVDLINAKIGEGDWDDPGWLLSAPTRLLLAQARPGRGHTVIGLADTLRTILLEEKERAHAAVVSRYTKGRYVQDPHRLAMFRALLNEMVRRTTKRLQQVLDGPGALADKYEQIAGGKARIEAIVGWLTPSGEEPVLAYRCLKHRRLPSTCLCNLPEGFDPYAGDDDAESPYHPDCLIHGEIPDNCDSDSGYGCFYQPLDPRWATKVAWIARLLTHPDTRGDLTLAEARHVLVAAVDATVGFDSEQTVEQVRGVLTEEVWNDPAVHPEAAIASLHNIVHVPLDLDTDSVNEAESNPTGRDYVIAHLLGCFAAIDRQMFTFTSEERLAKITSAMYRDPAGRTQIARFAAAHTPERWALEVVSDGYPDKPRPMRLVGRDGKDVLDEFGQSTILGRGDFSATWLVLR